MDLSRYSLQDLVVTALKSEWESREVYTQAAEMVENALLKDRLRFLAQEEDKHRLFFEKLYRKLFVGQELHLPEKSPVPLPEIAFQESSVRVSTLFTSAMTAEKAAEEFYHAMAKLFTAGSEEQKTLDYFASMEKGHYRLLEVERDEAERAEDYEIEWPMIHVGP